LSILTNTIGVFARSSGRRVKVPDSLENEVIWPATTTSAASDVENVQRVKTAANNKGFTTTSTSLPKRKVDGCALGRVSGLPYALAG
jgi:hypothetical protein